MCTNSGIPLCTHSSSRNDHLAMHGIFVIPEYAGMTRNRMLRDSGPEGDAGMCNFRE